MYHFPATNLASLLNKRLNGSTEKLISQIQHRHASFYDFGEINCFKCNLRVGSINIKKSDEVESLEKTIDKALNLRQHMENLCSATQFKLQALR